MSPGWLKSVPNDRGMRERRERAVECWMQTKVSKLGRHGTVESSIARLTFMQEGMDGELIRNRGTKCDLLIVGEEIAEGQ